MKVFCTETEFNIEGISWGHFLKLCKAACRHDGSHISGSQHKALGPELPFKPLSEDSSQSLSESSLHTQIIKLVLFCSASFNSYIISL